MVLLVNTNRWCNSVVIVVLPLLISNVLLRKRDRERERERKKMRINAKMSL